MSIALVGPALAWAAAGAALTLVAGAAFVGADGAGQPWKLVLLPALWVVPGALIAHGRPRNPLGWGMVAVGAQFAGSAFATQWVESGHTGGAGWAVWYADRAAAALVPCTLIVLLLLPNGRLPGPRWRPAAGMAVGAQLLLVALWCLVRGPAANPDSTWPVDPANPLGLLPAAWAVVLNSVASWVLQVPLLLGLAAIVVRLRRGEGDERGRLVSVLAAAAVFAILVVVGRALWPSAADVLDIAGSALLAAALTSAVLRHRLHGVDVVVRQAFVYAVLTTMIALAYVGVVAAAGGLGERLPAYGVGVVTAVIALSLLPVRGLLQQWLNRTMFGEAHDPAAAVRRLSTTVGDSTSLDEVVTGLSRAVAASLRAQYVDVSAGRARATHGTPGRGDLVRLPLAVGQERLGVLTVALAPGRRFRQHERDLVTELADHGSRAVHAVQLAEQLLTNRQLLVTAREEERSRLRRDLHDELGPTLAGLAMQLAGLQELLQADPAVAAERLARLEVAARHALDDVRRLSRELRPPSLDDLGLLGAVVRAGEEAGLHVSLKAGPRPALPAAVEVAAYRIAVEALLNVARHAGVRRAAVAVQEEAGSLVVRVRDQGVGIGQSEAGVGILAMRERAAELGGTLTVSDDSGTTLEARLPLPAAVESPSMETVHGR